MAIAAKKNTKPIPSGPRQVRDATKTQANILQWATQAFAKQGYRGTSLREILSKAKVNKRMIYHYFGNKAGLYRAVHVRQWELLSQWFAKSLGANGEALAGDVQERLLTAVGVFHEYSASHPEFLKLLMWDGLEGGEVSRSIWEEIRGPLYRQIEALVQEAQEKGQLAADLKVDHLIVSFMGAILFYFAYAGSLEDIFGKPTLSPKAIEERKEQTLALFRKIFK